MDDFDLELDVEIEESTMEITEPVDIRSTIGVTFLRNDPLLNGDAVRVIDSQGSVLALGAGGTKNNLQIGTSKSEIKINLLPPPISDDLDVDLDDFGVHMSADEIDDVDIDENPYEMVLAGKHTGALAVQTIVQDTVKFLYPAEENEVKLVENQAKTVHNFIYKPSKYITDMNKDIRDYLDLPQFNVFSKHAKFAVNELDKDADFRTLIKSRFTQIIGGAETLDGLIATVINAYEISTKKDITQEMINTITNLMEDFVRYALVKTEVARSKFEENSYVRQYDSLKMPTLIANFEYKCECGGVARMPNNRPTICFLIQSNSDNVFIINEPVQCNECGDWLALTNALAQVIETSANALVATGSRYKQNRIYRPKIEDLKNIIPADALDMFQLDVANIVDSELSNDNKINSVGVTYKRLINMWMSNQESQFEIVEAQQSFEEESHEAHMVDILAYSKFDTIPELETYQFTKTLLHYLESFSLFTLTAERKMLYETYQTEGYNRKPFSDEFAIKWIDDNAAHLAGMNNIFQGDMDLGSLYLLPEYYKVINRVVMLHLLADKEKLAPGTEISSWANNPNAELSLPVKLAKMQEDNLKHRSTRQYNPKMVIPTSKRDLRDSGIVHPLEAWSDLYHFAKNVGPIILERFNPTPAEKSIINEALTKERHEFYGMDSETKLIVTETLRKEEFEAMFKEYGFLLLTGLILDETRRNLAIYIDLMDFAPILQSNRDMRDLKQYFKRGTASDVKVSNVLWSKEYSPQLSQNDLDSKRLKLILESTDLPGTLNDYREEFGVKSLIDNFDEFRDQFQNDETFMSKYGEVLSCFW